MMRQTAGPPTKLQSYRTTSRGTVKSVILFTGATGNVSQHVVSRLLRMGAAVLALTRNLGFADLPGEVNVGRGNSSVPDTLDTCMDGIDGVTAIFLTSVTKHVRRIVCLSSEIVGDGFGQHTDTITAPIPFKLAV